MSLGAEALGAALRGGLDSSVTKVGVLQVTFEVEGSDAQRSHGSIQAAIRTLVGYVQAHLVGRCRLSLSNPS
jgi:hypothetical protein